VLLFFFWHLTFSPFSGQFWLPNLVHLDQIFTPDQVSHASPLSYNQSLLIYWNCLCSIAIQSGNETTLNVNAKSYTVGDLVQHLGLPFFF